jgi:PAS domain S-box-containing protein
MNSYFSGTSLLTEDDISIISPDVAEYYQGLNSQALKEAEERAKEADERANIMLEQTPLVVMLWNKNLQILDCNQEAVRLFGLSSKQEYIEKFFSLAPEYQPNGITSLELAQKALAQGLETGYGRIEWVLNHAVTGEAIPFDVTLARVKYNGENIVISYAQDLRERKAMEEETKKAYAEVMKAYAKAESASEAKSCFVANMNHEMRTPMNVIVGLTNLMMEEDNVPDLVKETLEKINTAGNTLMGLINSVLDFSKAEAGRLEMVPVQYDTASLLNDIINLNMIRIQGRPITLKLDIREDLLANLFGDDLRIKQILNNLISNAFKYTKEGSVTLSAMSDRMSDTVWLTFTVRDTGIGIRQEDIGKLFSDYNQVDTHANRKIEGTGLGLSITKKLVGLMDGEITVESEYGKGSTFRVRIPQGFVTDTPIGREIVENLQSFRYSDRKKTAQKLKRADLSHAKVLVVDDFPTNLDVAAGMLRKYKMQVDCVDNGEEAVRRIATENPRYNAIFMDHMMPDMDGIEATKAIRGLETEYAEKIPIIALTANAVAGNEQMFLDNGFNAFLPKPFNVMHLDSVVQRWVRDKRREQGTGTKGLGE